jgi:hypothetical protein
VRFCYRYHFLNSVLFVTGIIFEWYRYHFEILKWYRYHFGFTRH